MWEVELDEVEKYAPRMQNTVAQYIAMRLILDLCEEACGGRRHMYLKVMGTVVVRPSGSAVGGRDNE